MKRVFFLNVLVIALFSFRTATSIYSISVQNINNASISLNVYQSKNIIIAVFNPASPNTVFLKALDSLAIQNTNVKIIAIPAKELGAGSTSALATLAGTFSSGLMVTKPMNVRKNAGANQHALFKWLTNYSENGHFDVDVSEAEQVFVVNASGNLYAVLQQSNTEAIRQIVNQPVSN